MITRLLLGLGRLLFNAAVLVLVVAAVLVYGAVRLLKAAFARQAPMPVRDAGFQTLLALVALAQALRAAMPADVREKVGGGD